MDINSIRELELTPEQLAWVVSLPYLFEDMWKRDDDVLYRESKELRVQVTKVGDVFRIITWK